jgi:RNA polymerase-binding protein DksA
MARRAAKVEQAAPSALAVRTEEQPWTDDEVAMIRAGLLADVDRLRAELEAVDAEIAVLLRDPGEGAGDDQADSGSAAFEREHEMTIAENARTLLLQSEHALERLADGSYGTCEVCGGPVGKRRLQAFPRATVCVDCKRAQERR